MLLLTIQQESCFIINEHNDMAITYSMEGLFSSQVSLKNWISFVQSMEYEADAPVLKAEM